MSKSKKQIKPVNKPSRTPGISRIDQPSHRTHGFFVRVTYKGKIHSAFFSDKKHGGRQPAFLAAQMCHQKLRAKFGLPRRADRRWNSQIVRRRGRSGIHGVQRVIVRGGRRLRKYWTATWSPKLGVIRRKQFSIRRYGEEKALRLAIRARRAGLRSIK